MIVSYFAIPAPVSAKRVIFPVMADGHFFFIIALFVCPIGFLVGVIGSIVLFANQKVYK